MTPRERLAHLEEHLSRLTTRCRNLSSDVYRATDLARSLYIELTETEAELTRHHRDFARISDVLDEYLAVNIDGPQVVNRIKGIVG